jgi:hypothetical protein
LIGTGQACETLTYYKDKAFGADVHWIEQRFPDQEIKVLSRTKDERSWLVTAVSDTEPGQTLMFDRKTHATSTCRHRK